MSREEIIQVDVTTDEYNKIHRAAQLYRIRVTAKVPGARWGEHAVTHFVRAAALRAATLILARSAAGAQAAIKGLEPEELERIFIKNAEGDVGEG